MQRLRNKIAVITGGAGGIGSATAKRFLDEGASVAIADLNIDYAKKLARELGERAFAVFFDAGDTESIRAMIEATVKHFGHIDILHNNAALTSELQRQDTTATDIPFEIWDLTMETNLRSYLAACKYAIPHMIKRGGGSIINTASRSGMIGDLSRIAYGSSKGGIIAMSKYIATQYGRDGIRCNSIAPGLILTETSKRTVPELIEIVSRHVLTTRLGNPEDIAALAAFLASDESGYITGQNICIDGGGIAHQPHTYDLYNFMQQVTPK